MMKKIYIQRFCLMLALSFCLSASSWAQAGERVQAMKIAYFTRTLQLSPEEAKYFWPIYDEYSDKLEVLRKENRRREQRMRREINSLNDREVEQMTDAYIGTKQKETELLATYHIKFKEVLPIRKLIRMYKAEQEFTKRILAEWRDRQKK